MMTAILPSPQGRGAGGEGAFLPALLLAAALLLISCDGRSPQTGRPLLDAEHVPDVLVEAESLALRPTHDGNRFLDGWWPARQGELVLHANGAGARLELVHLETRPRSLVLDLDAARPLPADAEVAYRAAGRDLGAVPLADPLVLPLPADLPRGRVTVEIEPGGAPLPVRAAALRPAASAGEVMIENGTIVQSGFSAVDVVRRLDGETVLHGRFEAPSGARPEQRFEIEIARQDRAVERVTAFTWKPRLRDRLLGARRFAVRLGGAGHVRLRFLAHGEGPPARWTDLQLAGSPAPQREVASPPETRPTRPDLVVLYVMDALRADAVGHFGGLPGLPDELRRRVTPVYDRLAREGVAYYGHRSVAPNTLPSTKALLTGEVWVDRGGWNLPPDGPPTLAEQFHRAGYRTGLFSANVYVGPAYGVDRGFEHVTEVELLEDRAEYSDTAERLHEAALRWLATLGDDEPAFLYVHTVHPHNPYAPPAPLGARFTRGIDSSIDGSTRTLLDVEHKRRAVDKADRERLRRLYLAGLRYNDRELGRFLAALERRYPERRLFLALTSDHGEELFDHGGILHGYTLYEEMIRIPLVLFAPGILEPASVERPTSTLDLHNTLTDLADLASAASPPPSLAPHFAAAASVRGGIFSAQSEHWKLIWAPRTGRDWGQGARLGRDRSPEYLFDLRADPEERRNLAGEGDLEAAWLRSRLRAWIAARASPEEGGEEKIDDDVRRRLEALGYVD